MKELTQENVDLIKQFEGKRLTAYQDSVGIWTIGYGHTKGVYEGMKITEKGASQFLIEDLAVATACVNRVIKRPMNDQEFGAFVSLTHNIGVGAFAGSTAARMFNKGDKDGARQGILMWNKITVRGKKIESMGLANRRSIEALYFEAGLVDSRYVPSEYETTAGDGGAHKSSVPPAAVVVSIVAALALFWDRLAMLWDKIQAFIGGLF